MIADFFTFAFTMVVLLAFFLVRLLLAPIDFILAQLIPNYGNALQSVQGFFNIISNVIGWVISFSGIPVAALSLLAAYLIFKYTVPLQIYFLKLAGKWYARLKP